jgi:predicted ATP-dependent endonuclease of OLD family
VSLIERVTIHGYRGARDVELSPAAIQVLVGESSSGKSTVLAAIWTLLEAAAPMPTAADVSHGYTRVHVEAVVGERTLFLDARPPATLNLNREGAPPALFFPANLRPTTLLAPTDHPAKRAVGVVRQEETDDGGLSLVRSIGALVEARVRGLVVLIEEPELYLSPPAQRHLHRLLRRLAARGRNQVVYSTHSPVFLGVDRLEELVLVRHDARSGTTLLQPEAPSRPKAFRMLAEFDAERAEIFLSRAVLLVEGRTEKLAFPFVFRALGYDVDQEAITVVDCQGKGNIPLFAEICNACNIPYVVVHDRDAARGQQPTEAEQIANDAIVRVAGRKRTVMLVPDFEGVTGVRARRGKPAAAFRRFQNGEDGDVPGPLRQAVERVVAAARRAPRTTRGA